MGQNIPGEGNASDDLKLFKDAVDELEGSSKKELVPEINITGDSKPLIERYSTTGIIRSSWSSSQIIEKS